MYSRQEKIDFIKEIAALEGGCIILKNKRYSSFIINNILSSGIVKDEDYISHRKYDMPIINLDDNYVNYVFNEIDNARYTAETKFIDIFNVVREELGHIKFFNDSFLINGQKYEVDTIKLNLKTNTMSVSYYINNLPVIAWDIYELEEDVVYHIKEQIKHNKYI